MPKAKIPLRSRRGWQICFLTFLAVLPLLPFGIFIALLLWRDAAAGQEVERRLAAIQAAGEPVDDATLDAYYQAGSNPRHTNQWLAVLDVIASDAFTISQIGVSIFDADAGSSIPPSGEPWNEEEATRAFLKQWNSTYRTAIRLSNRGLPIAFPRQWNSYNTELPQLQNVRSLSILMQLGGELEIRDNNPTAVRQIISAQLRLGNALVSDPVFVSQLTSIAIDGNALRLLQNGIEKNLFSQTDLRTMLPLVLQSKDISPGWRRAVVGERAMTLPIFHQEKLRKELVDDMPRYCMFRSNDELRYLDIVQATLDIDTSSLNTFHKQSDELANTLEQRFSTTAPLAVFDSSITSQIAPSVTGYGYFFVRQAMSHRLAALAMGVRLHELEHGKFPDSLDALEPYGLVLTDLMPLGDRPFGYQSSTSNASLWGFNPRNADFTPDAPEVPTGNESFDWEVAPWHWKLTATTHAQPSREN